MLTLEHIDKAWASYEKFKETAEQHDFASIAFWDFKTVPLYEDLHKNWDEHHAEIFMKGMKFLSSRFGFELPEE